MDDQFLKLLELTGRITSRMLDKIADREAYKGYYTYIPFQGHSQLIETLGLFKFNSFLDLGCGVPIIPYVVKLAFPNVKCAGVEVRQEIVETCKTAFFPGVTLTNADIFSLDANFLKDYDCLYLFVPIHNNDLMEKFMDQLVPKLKPGHIVVGASIGFSTKHKDVLRLIPNTGSFYVYQKL